MVTILDDIYQMLQSKLPGAQNIGYSLTYNNQLMNRFVSDTPNVWGQNSSSVQPGAGDFIVQDVIDYISNAEAFVDITSLCQFPDLQFQQAIMKSLEALADSGRLVKVRILVGWFTPADVMSGYPTQSEYITELIQPLIGKAGNLEIYVAAQQTNLLSWNHSKILAVDGKYCLLGGENMWTNDYLVNEPVHDLNVKLAGSTVYYMHKFIDSIWESVDGYIEPWWKSVYWKSGMDTYETGCLPDCGLPAPLTLQPERGDVAVLGAGRYGDLGSYGQPADDALAYILNMATRSIYIAQEDLLAAADYWKPAMAAIAKAIMNNVDVYIVLSNDHGKSGSGNTYSESTVAITAYMIFGYTYLSDFFTSSGMSWDDLQKLVCDKLHLTTLRFGPDNNWPNGYEFAQHAKFVMVDEAVFYVGSENLYPSNLIEYGVLLDDPAAIQAILTNYWQPLWKWSSKVAVSGSGAPSCILMSDNGAVKEIVEKLRSELT